MKWRSELKFPVEVKWHLNGGFTQLRLRAGSEPFLIDIETACDPEEHDTAQDIREALKECDAIEPLDAYWTDCLDRTPDWPQYS